MSEDAIKAALGIEDQPQEVEQSQQQEEQQQEQELELTSLEQKAYDQGWRPQDQFDGDEDHWRSAREYVDRGELLDSIKQQKQRGDRLERDFKERIEQLNKFNDVKLQQEVESLQTQQRQAVEVADTDAYDAAQKQIDNLKQQPVQSQPAKDPAMEEWESNNSWINDTNDPRSFAAQGVWNSFVTNNPGATIQQALAHVDSKMEAMNPPQQTPTNPRRDMPSSNETRSKPAGRKARGLTMDDLTQDEVHLWRHAGLSIFGGDEKAFLKTVADSRNK